VGSGLEVGQYRHVLGGYILLECLVYTGPPRKVSPSVQPARHSHTTIQKGPVSAQDGGRS
jgi:hypothetical protein